MRARHQRVPLANQLDTSLLDRCQIRAARHERNLGAGQRKLGTDVPADRASTEDANFHAADSEGASPSFAAKPIRCSFPVAPFGISFTKTIFRGTLKSAKRLEANSLSSRSVRVWPSRGDTSAPHRPPMEKPSRRRG